MGGVGEGEESEEREEGFRRLEREGGDEGREDGAERLSGLDEEGRKEGNGDREEEGLLWKGVVRENDKADECDEWEVVEEREDEA